MASDEPTPEQEEAWVIDQRRKVEDYLAGQGCNHGGVGEWPAFHVTPYLAIWAIRSKIAEGHIGWWAISGDCPTDYMSGKDADHPRKAMMHFSRLWNEAAECMERGKSHETVKIGTKENSAELAALLRSRSKLLGEWSLDESIWTK